MLLWIVKQSTKQKKIVKQEARTNFLGTAVVSFMGDKINTLDMVHSSTM